MNQKRLSTIARRRGRLAMAECIRHCCRAASDRASRYLELLPDSVFVPPGAPGVPPGLADGALRIVARLPIAVDAGVAVVVLAVAARVRAARRRSARVMRCEVAVAVLPVATGAVVVAAPVFGDDGAVDMVPAGIVPWLLGLELGVCATAGPATNASEAASMAYDEKRRRDIAVILRPQVSGGARMAQPPWQRNYSAVKPPW